MEQHITYAYKILKILKMKTKLECISVVFSFKLFWENVHWDTSSACSTRSALWHQHLERWWAGSPLCLQWAQLVLLTCALRSHDWGEMLHPASLHNRLLHRAFSLLSLCILTSSCRWRVIICHHLSPVHAALCETPPLPLSVEISSRVSISKANRTAPQTCTAPRRG